MGTLTQDQIDLMKMQVKKPATIKPESREVAQATKSDDRGFLEKIRRAIGIVGSKEEYLENIRQAGPLGQWEQLKAGATPLRRAEQLVGLGTGTLASAVQEGFEKQHPYIGGYTGKWIPDIQDAPEAFSAFVDEVRRGELEAGIKAYQEEMPGGPGYWGTAEIAGTALLPAGLAKTGAGLIAKAPALARTAGRVLPATRGGVKARAGIQEGVELLGKGLKKPWEAEELAGQAIAAPFRKGAEFVKGRAALRVEARNAAARKAAEKARPLKGTPEDVELTATLPDAEAKNIIDASDPSPLIEAPVGWQQSGIADDLLTGRRGGKGRRPKPLNETIKETEALIARVATPDEVAIKDKAYYMAGKKVKEVSLSMARTLLRRHEAAVNVIEIELGKIVRNGEGAFRSLGLSVGRHGREAILKEATEKGKEIHELYRALHGQQGAVVPKRLRGVYEELRRLTKWEENARIDFDPEIKLVDGKLDERMYFYRGWKMGDKLKADIRQAKSLGRPPDYYKPRGTLDFDGMIDAGFEPISWNPYEQWRVGTLQGMRYREQILLIKRMKNLGIAQSSNSLDDAPMPGWRVPKIGPAFEGKTYAYIDEATGKARTALNRWAVPDNVATRLENLYGKTPQMGTIQIGRHVIDPMKVIDALTFIPKRAKLYLSFFQQQDFLTRSWAGTWTKMVDELTEGVKTKDPTSAIRAVRHLATWPDSAYKILKANLSPGYRARLKSQLTSTKELVPGRPGIHLKGIMEAGLSIRDVTMFPANMDEVMKEIASENGLLGVKKVMRLISEIDSASRRGLFDGVYPAAQITDIQNNVAPLIYRQFPDATDEAINGMIAKMINMKYSTIPASQSIFQNQVMRMILQRLFFSVGESEGLLRQAFEAIPHGGVSRLTEKVAGKMGKKITIPVTGRMYGGVWRRHWAGAYLSLLATANAIHFASTGKPLPKERYIPLQKDGWGWLPVGYRTQFAAPTLPTGKDAKLYAPLSRLPLGGRNATENTLDLVGQMDTAFRILSPLSFLASRESVPVRALSNQVTGTNFFGEPIDEVGPGGIVSRTASLIKDMFAPIGVGETVTEILREQVPGFEEVLPFGEGRTGVAGKVIRSAGIGVRGESTPNLRNRLAKESGLINPDTNQPVQTWDELLPGQVRQVRAMFPQLSEEEEIRTKVQAERQNEYSLLRVEAQSFEDDLIRKANRLSAAYLDVPLTSGDYSPESARKRLARAEDIYYGELYGTKWSEEKGRFTGGVYDEDRDFEEPEENTIAHALWRYRKIYQDARDHDTGEVDFSGESGDLLNKALNKFWADLSKREVALVISNIRLIEGNYSNQMQVMKDAGRYAGSFRLNFDGELVSYYDLENHSVVESYIATRSGASRQAVSDYLDKTISERKAARNTPEGEDIGEALDRAARKNGILWQMRRTFIASAPNSWIQAMFEAGYDYTGKPEIEREIFDQIRAGRTQPKQDYERLYLDALPR